MSRALTLALEQKGGGKSIQHIANEIGYSRPAVSRYLSGTYGDSVAAVETALLKTYDRRICPVDKKEKPAEYCQRNALTPRPHGFPDADSLWKTCQSCPHKPEGKTK